MKRLLLLLCGGIFFAHTLSAQCSFAANVNAYPTCFAQPSGFANVNVTGGVGPFNYQWLAPINQTGPGVGGLAPGAYQVSVFDNGTMCGDTISFIITQMQQIQTAVSTTDASCWTCDGTAVVTVMGGTAPYTYSWNNGATGAMATGLCAGTYMVTITDAMGCSVNQTVTINNAAPILYTITPTTATCGQCDGSLTINATGGTGALTYSIDGGVTYQASPVFNNMCAGAYLMVITDANNCHQSNVITMPTTTGFTVTFDTVQAPGCGMCNGSLIALPVGGVQPYTYAWTGVGASVDSLGTGICAGASVLITDGAGCVVNTGYTPVTSTVPGLTVTHSSIPESAAGMNDGSIDVTVTGAAGTLNYLWSNGASTQDVSSLSNGSYTLYISDNLGNCSQHSFTVALSPPQYGFISGTVYDDSNLNCTKDAGENNVWTGNVVAQPGNYYGYMNSMGVYNIWAPYGTYTVTHTPGYGVGASPACTMSYNVTLNNSTPSSVNNNFADTIVHAADAALYLYSSGIVPGFNGVYQLYYYNILPLAASGTIEFILPDTLTYVSSNVTPAAISGDTLWFNYINLSATQSLTITFNTPANPALLGTYLTACATINVTNTTDINLANNNACYSRMVTGSYDPNDKSVSPTGDGPTGKILLAEDTFTYLIRFQNTGNGPAVNIHVDDTISNLLDMSTFEMLGASHSYSIVTKPGNVLVWQFDNINLPDSGSNEPASHGWIQFKIKAKSNMVIGNVINNTADIYFDFNPPVITNTTVNTYSLPDFIEEITNENSVSVYPNPTSDVLNIVHPAQGKGMIKIAVLDVAGREVKTTAFTGTQMSMDVKDLAPGMYVLQANTNGVNYTTRFVRK